MNPESTSSPVSDAAERTGLLRRLASWVYDLVLLFAIVLIGSLPAVWLNGGAIVPGSPLYLPYLLYLLLLVWGFYAWFWTHSGQTLGMKAWRVRLQKRGGGAADLRSVALRLLATPLSLLPAGAGYLWLLFDDGLAWHDRLSGTELVTLPRATRVH